MANLSYEGNLTVKQIIDALNQVDRTNERVWKKAEKDADRAIKQIIANQKTEERQNRILEKSIEARAKAYDKLAQSAAKAGQSAAKGGGETAVGGAPGISAGQLGLVSGAVSALTTEFIRLGEQAIGVLTNIGQQAVQTALEMDTLKARLGGIFDGSQEAADQAFTFIQQKSKELGIDLSELAGAFLPKTESLAQFERVAKIATALARSDPEQGAIGARIALIEAMSGTFTSLQRRFEIPKEDIDRIKEAFDQQGMEGFLSTLEKVLDESGKSFDDLANTAQTSFDRLGIAGEQLGGRLGVPIVEALEEASNKILDFLNTNEDDLIVFADTIGRAIADVIDFISGVDLGALDTDQLIEFADYIRRVLEAAELLAIQLSGLGPLFDGLINSAAPVGKVFEALAYVLSNIDEALYTAAQATAIAKASYAGLTASIEPLIDVLINLTKAAAQSAALDYAGAVESLGNAATAIQDNTESQAAFNASLMESQKGFDAYNQAIEDNKTKQDELRTTLDEQANAGTEAADAILAAGAAQRQAAEDAGKLQEAQDKVNEALGKAEKDFQRKLEDIDRETERKRLDIQIEFAQKREDAAQANLEKLADIRRKYGQSVDDAATDLARKEEDIARKFGQERIDLEREQRQERVDIERNFRQSLQDIQSQFLTDAEDAERKRDAIAFLKAMRERDQKVQEAQVGRTREIEEARITGEQKRQELKIQQERELEEARIANERKLEDLKANLERQIEEQNIAYSRQLDDLQTAEERKFEELQRSRERDIEDAKTAYNRKLEDLQVSLADELATLKEGNARLEEEAKRHAAVMEDSQRSIPTTSTTSRTMPDRVINDTERRPTTPRTMPDRIVRRQHGGPVIKNNPYLVGERGAEMFVPEKSGTIIPNNRIMANSGGSRAGGNTTYNSGSSISARIDLTDPSALSATQMAIIRREVVRMFQELLGG